MIGVGVTNATLIKTHFNIIPPATRTGIIYFEFSPESACLKSGRLKKGVIQLTGWASQVSTGSGSSVQYMGSAGWRIGGRGGGGRRNSGGGPGQSHSAAASIPHMLSRSGGSGAGSSSYSTGLSIGLIRLLERNNQRILYLDNQMGCVGADLAIDGAHDI